MCAVRREENDVSLHARWAVPMAVRAFWAVIGSKMQAHAPLSDSRSNAKIFLFSTMQNHTPFSDSRSSVKLFYDNAKSCSYTCACTIVLRPIQSHSVSTIMSTAKSLSEGTMHCRNTVQSCYIDLYLLYNVQSICTPQFMIVAWLYGFTVKYRPYRPYRPYTQLPPPRRILDS